MTRSKGAQGSSRRGRTAQVPLGALALLVVACAGAGGAPEAAARAAAGERATGPLGVDYTTFLGMLDAGRSKAAVKAAEAIGRRAEAAIPAGAGHSSEPFENLEIYAAAPLWAALRFGAWESVLAREAPPADRPIAVALLHMARGVALAQRRDLQGAAAEREAFGAARVRVDSEARLGHDLAQDVLNVAGFVLDGRFLEAKGDRDRALASFRSAVQAGDTLSGAPPPGWYHAPRESLGGALLRAGRYQEAEQVFRAGIDRRPGDARLLFGLSLALAAAHKPAESDATRDKFQSAWRHADVPLTLEDL